MATIVPLKITEDGVTGALGNCAGGGDEFTNSGVEFIRIYNGNASTRTVTITAQTTNYYLPRYGKLTKSNTTKTVANGETILLGPFRPSTWNDVNDKVQITYNAVTDLKIEVLYLEQK